MSAENSKPEWFQMSQSDAFESKPASKRVLRIIALATPLFVLGAGLVFAQSQSTPGAVTTALPTTTVAATTATPASNPVHITQAASTTQKAAITIAKPGIKLPTGGGDDD